MKLSEWARRQGVSHQPAWRWVKDGKMPVPVRQAPSGTWLVVLDPTGTTDGLVRDITEALTSMCAPARAAGCEEPGCPRGGRGDRRGRRVRKFRPQPGFQVQAFRFAPDPNASQEAAPRSHCGAARVACDWAVGWVTASWWQRRAEESCKVAEASLTEWRPWSLPALRKAFNAARHTDPGFAGWWEANSKEAYNTGLANAAAAFDNYAKPKNGKRRDKRMGTPRFKPKRKARLSCRFTTGAIRVDDGGRHVTLPRPGTIRTMSRP